MPIVFTSNGLRTNATDLWSINMSNKAIAYSFIRISSGVQLFSIIQDQQEFVKADFILYFKSISLKRSLVVMEFLVYHLDVTNTSIVSSICSLCCLQDSQGDVYELREQ